MITAPVEQRQYCQADLKGADPNETKRRQITELPMANKPPVIETRRHEAICPHCQKTNYGALPEGLEAERYFGPNLEATVVYYKHEQHLSYERILETMSDLHGATLSEGAVAQILERAGRKAEPAPEAIKQQVITGRVIKSDETSARVEGRNRFMNGQDGMTLRGFQGRVTQIENRLDSLPGEAVRSAAARKLLNHFTTHRDKQLNFLRYPEIPPTNNESEQTLRPSVVHRKVTNGFRSKWGARAYADLQTALATARRKGKAVLQTLADLMGTPVLPFLEVSRL